MFVFRSRLVQPLSFGTVFNLTDGVVILIRQIYLFYPQKITNMT